MVNKNKEYICIYNMCLCERKSTVKQEKLHISFQSEGL